MTFSMMTLSMITLHILILRKDEGGIWCNIFFCDSHYAECRGTIQTSQFFPLDSGQGIQPYKPQKIKSNFWSKNRPILKLLTFKSRLQKLNQTSNKTVFTLRKCHCKNVTIAAYVYLGTLGIANNPFCCCIAQGTKASKSSQHHWPFNWQSLTVLWQCKWSLRLIYIGKVYSMSFARFPATVSVLTLSPWAEGNT